MIPKKETYETSLTRLTIFQDRTFDTLPSLAKKCSRYASLPLRSLALFVTFCLQHFVSFLTGRSYGHLDTFHFIFKTLRSAVVTFCLHFLPCPHLFSGAGHVGQRLFPGAPGGIFVSRGVRQQARGS